MGLMLCKCCCCCCIRTPNSVGVIAEKSYKVLLLGLVGSGKTELGHVLSKKKRLDYESSNGVQCYQMQQPEGQQLSITEVGGNEEMQKIWHHYFVTTMGIIYCFDMSANYEKLQNSFALLRQTLSHPFVRGKPILLVGTKSDLANEGVQLYDIENTFQLDALAKFYSSSTRLCCYGVYGAMEESSTSDCKSLTDGVSWLFDLLMENYDLLKVRIKCDSNMKTWQSQADKLVAEGKIKRDRYQRFKKPSRNKFWRLHTTSGRVRPQTAPANIFYVTPEPKPVPESTSTDLSQNPKPVPTLDDIFN